MMQTLVERLPVRVAVLPPQRATVQLTDRPVAPFPHGQLDVETVADRAV